MDNWKSNEEKILQLSTKLSATGEQNKIEKGLSRQLKRNEEQNKIAVNELQTRVYELTKR